MNFRNDFGPGSSIVGWEAMAGGMPGPIIPVGSLYSFSGGDLLPGSANAIAVLPSKVVGPDIEVEAHFLKAFIAAAPQSESGILLRLTGTTGILVYFIGNNQIQVLQYNGSGWDSIKTATYTVGRYDTVRLRVALNGANLVAYVNDVLALTATVTTLVEGRVGLRWYTPAALSGLASGIAGTISVPSAARIDCEYEVLAAKGFPGTISEKEMAWLKSEGATGNTLMDCWDTFLTAKVGYEGSLLSRRRRWLLAMIGVDPAIGTTWIQLWKNFWCELKGGSSTPLFLLRDPYFTLPFGDLWSGVAPGDYDTATVWFSGAASNSDITQEASFFAAALPVTFYARLKRTSTQATTVTLVAGATTLGTITIAAGQLFGSTRIVLPAGVAKSITFKVTLTTAGTKYLDFFDDPLTGWERGNYNPNGAALTPLAGEAYTQDGKIYAGPVAAYTVFPPGADILNGSVFGMLDANAADGIGLVGRFTTTNAVMCQKESVGLVTYEWTGNWSFKGSVALPSPAILRMNFEGNFVHIVVNDVEQAVYPLSNATVAGRMGIFVGSSAPNGPMFESLGVEGGGVFFEALGGQVVEADGGVPQTPNPYFDGTTGWLPTAYVSGNKITLPGATLNPLSNTVLPGTVAVTQTVVCRCWVESMDENTGLFVARGQGNDRHYLGLGWNAFDIAPVPAGANAQNIYVAIEGTAAVPAVIHFFIGMGV